MKVKDIIIKIINDEGIPPVIKAYDITYHFEEPTQGNLNFVYENELGEYWLDNLSINDEVEIIEEDKKIEEIGSWYEILEQESKKTQLEEINHNFYKIFDRLEQLIDEVNKLKEEK